MRLPYIAQSFCYSNLKKNEESGMNEEELKNLLASLYKEPAKDEHFEERFLSNFHERVVQSAVSPPASRRIWDDVCHFFSNMTMPKLAISSAAVLTLFAGFFSLSMFSTGGAGSAIASKNPNLNTLRASLNEVLGSDPSRTGHYTQNQTAKIPEHFEIRCAPKRQRHANYTGSNVFSHEHRPVIVDGVTVYVEQGSADTTLNIKLVETP